MSDFYIEKKIYYHDTDAGGVVYYASYLKHLEEGRSEYFRNLGLDTAEYAKNGIIFPVVRLEIDYKKPARYGDGIRVFTRPEMMGNASIHFFQEIKRGEDILVFARVICACVNRDLKPIKLPQELREKIGI
ncbi:MAG: acyl-CoA thioesterase [Candidatus Omnitrophica bacterium]|nr:acyl-CoA thioesterase [Candidatus Omnitrophota bacterium]MCM8790183.1 acyl-CoA thioesterase [Candidatus Omnitrophota bacterium]